MSVAVASVSTQVESANTDSTVIAKPSGTAEGDVLFAAIATDDSRTITSPAGWFPVFTVFANGTDCSLAGFARKAGASEPSPYTFPFSAEENSVSSIARITGITFDNFLGSVQVTTGDDASPTTPSITMQGTDAIAISIFAIGGDSAAPGSGPSGWTTEYLTDSGGLSGAACGGGLAWKHYSAATDTGAVAWSTDAAEGWCGVTVEIGNGVARSAQIYGASWVADGDGYALDFDGINDYCQIAGDPSDFVFTNGSTDTAFTLFCRVYIRNNYAASFFSKAADTGNAEWIFGTIGSGELSIFCYGDLNTAKQIRSISQSSITKNQWVNLAVSYDGSESENGLNLYVDGVLVAQSRVQGGEYNGMGLSTSPTQFGNRFKDNPTYQAYFDGFISTAIVYHRELSGSEVADLSDPEARADDFVSLWKFDEGTGTLTYDSATLPPAPAHDLQGADADALAIADPGAVEQTHSLAADPAEASADADTGEITQGAIHELAGADASAGAIADAGILVQYHALLGIDGEAEALADTAGISQVHILAGGDAEAEAIADSVRLILDTIPLPDLADWVTRLRAACPSLRYVGDAADFIAAQRRGSPVTPCAYVIPGRERAKPSQIIGGFVQLVQASHRVFIAVENHRDATGAAGLTEVEPIRDEIRNALAGWDWTPASGAITQSTGRLAQYDDDVLWWDDGFGFTYHVEVSV